MGVSSEDINLQSYLGEGFMLPREQGRDSEVFFELMVGTMVESTAQHEHSNLLIDPKFQITI